MRTTTSQSLTPNTRNSLFLLFSLQVTTKSEKEMKIHMIWNSEEALKTVIRKCGAWDVAFAYYFWGKGNSCLGRGWKAYATLDTSPKIFRFPLQLLTNFHQSFLFTHFEQVNFIISARRRIYSCIIHNFGLESSAILHTQIRIVIFAFFGIRVVNWLLIYKVKLYVIATAW